MRKTRQRNIAMLAAAILLCLVLISTFVVSGMLARFATGSGSGETARVAGFVITGNGFTQTLNLTVNEKLKPGSATEEQKFSVVNKSEVSVNYIVTVQNMTRNMPLEIKVGETTTSLDTAYTSTPLALSPNGDTNTFTFTVQWPEDKNNAVYSGMVDNLAITVTATQID